MFRLKRPYGPLLQRLDVVEASIIPKHQYDGHDLLSGEPTRRPVGTGPFRFVSYSPADRIVLERNPTYFRQGVPGIDRLVFRILPNAASAVAALESGEVDYTVSVPGPDIPRLQRTPGISVVKSAGGSGGSACQDVLIPNLTRRPFTDVRVRRAIAHAIDRPFLVERVYFGQGRPATGPISHLVPWAYTPEIRQYPHDTAAARKLLDEAGLRPNSTGERLAVTFTHGGNQQRLGQALREQLKPVGITLNLEMLDFTAAVDRVFAKKTFDLGLASYCNGADPDIGVRRVYVSSNIGPYPFSNGAELPESDDRSPIRRSGATARQRQPSREIYGDPAHSRRRRAVLLAGGHRDPASAPGNVHGIPSVDRRLRGDGSTGRRQHTMTRGVSAARWLTRRALLAVLVVAGVTALTFLLIHLAPGDPIILLAGDGGNASYYDAMRAKYGLDRPILDQFWRYVLAVMSGDFGYSFMYQQPVIRVLLDHVPATLLLGGTSLLLSIALGFGAALVCVTWPVRAVDAAIRAVASIAFSAPVYWTGQVFILVAAVKLGVLPAGGISSARESLDGLPYAADVFRHLLLPAFTLSLPFAAVGTEGGPRQHARDDSRAARARRARPRVEPAQADRAARRAERLHTRGDPCRPARGPVARRRGADRSAVRLAGRRSPRAPRRRAS